MKKVKKIDTSFFNNYDLTSFSQRNFITIKKAKEPEILVSFCIFIMLNHLPINDKNFRSEAHDMKMGLFWAYFKRVRNAKEPEILVSFSIFIVYHHLPTPDEKLRSEAHDMKMGPFFSTIVGPWRPKEPEETLHTKKLFMTELN